MTLESTTLRMRQENCHHVTLIGTLRKITGDEPVRVQSMHQGMLPTLPEGRPCGYWLVDMVLEAGVPFILESEPHCSPLCDFE